MTLKSLALAVLTSTCILLDSGIAEAQSFTETECLVILTVIDDQRTQGNITDEEWAKQYAKFLVAHPECHLVARELLLD